MASHTRPLHLIPAPMESAIAEAVDEWILSLPKGDQEIVNLHLEKLREGINHPGFGVKAAKCLLAVTYLKVGRHLKDTHTPEGWKQ